MVGMKRALLFLLAAGLACAAEPFFFIQMSDPQFGMYTGNHGFAQETANFEFAIATANRLRPAFVVVTGDLVNQPGDAAAIAEYRRIAAKLDGAIPIHHVAGNHDLGAEPTPESLAAYRAHFGPDYYTFRTGGMAAFVLNTTLLAAPAKAQAEADRQEAWLRAELEKARREGVQQMVVLQHHPFFLHTPDEADAYENIPRATRRRYLDLLRSYGVSHVFAGHYHGNAGGKDGPLEVVVTGPVGKPLRPGPRSGLRIVTVGAEGIAHRYHEFGDLPDRVNRP